MAPKKAAPPPAARPAGKQMTFAEAQAKAAQNKAKVSTSGGDGGAGTSAAQRAAAGGEAPVVHVVPQASWIAVRSNYDDWAQSAVISAASEAGLVTAGRPPAPIVAAAALTRAMSARPGGSNLLTQHGVDDEEEQHVGAAAAVPIWESRGLEFVAAIKRLLQPGQALSVQLQEFLMHMVLHHHLHASDLSLRALNLLMQNATLFPPSRLDPGAPGDLPAVLDTSHHLWTPVKPFRFDGMRRPAALPGSLPELFQFYRDLWTNAERFCKAGAGGGGGGGGGEGGVSRPGGVLLLLYVQHLLSLDWQVVRRALALLLQRQQREQGGEPAAAGGRVGGSGGNSSRRDGDKVLDQMARVIFACLQWRQMQLLGTGASRMLWAGSSQHEELLHSMTSALLSSSPSHSSSAPSSSTAAALRRGAAGEADGLWGAGVVSARLCAVAAQALADLTRMYSLAERVPSLYPKADSRATDCVAICKLLLKVLAADGDSSGLEAERSRAWVQELKPQGAKLRLLRALSPDVALRLLALHLVRLALKAWSSSSGGVSMLPDALQHWSDYEVAGGLKGAVRLDPGEVISALVPPPSTSLTPPPRSRTPTPAPEPTPPASPGPGAGPGEEEEEAGPTGGAGGRPAKRSRRQAPTGAAALLDQVSQMLFRVSPVPSQRGGFTLWLSSFVLVSLQHLEQAECEEGVPDVQKQRAALREAVARLEAWLQGSDRLKLVRAGCDADTLLAHRAMALALEGAGGAES